MTTFERYSLLIDSSKRQNLSEPSTNFSVNLTNGYSVKMARFKNACIPLTFYNITSANNAFTYQFSDNHWVLHTYTITIPIGRYTFSDLTSTISSLLGSQDHTVGTLTLTYNSHSGTFMFTSTPSFGFYAYIHVTQLITDLGFVSNYGTVPTIQIQGTYTSTNPIKFLSIEYLQLSLNYLGSSVITVNNNQSNTTFLLEMPSDSITGYFCEKRLITNINEDTGAKNNVYSTPIQLQSFKVTLSDKDNNIVDLNGYNWWSIIELIVVVDSSTSIPSTLTTNLTPNDPNNPSYLNSTKTAVTNSTPYWMRF